MKANYESRFRHYLTRRTPIIVRVDGRAFHTFTKDLDKPFDKNFIGSMIESAWAVAQDMHGCKAFYVQSDEASFFLTDYDTLHTDAWFDGNMAKINSVAASAMTAHFNEQMVSSLAMFDSRCFNVPREEVVNYFIWRMRDWERNSIQMLAQANFPHSELQGKKTPELHEMLHQKGINWADLSGSLKNGTLAVRDESSPTGYTRVDNPPRDYEGLSEILNPFVYCDKDEVRR
jgi:tRNA(His) 5'-end guanylyltransferase